MDERRNKNAVSFFYSWPQSFPCLKFSSLQTAVVNTEGTYWTGRPFIIGDHSDMSLRHPEGTYADIEESIQTPHRKAVAQTGITPRSGSDHCTTMGQNLFNPSQNSSLNLFKTKQWCEMLIHIGFERRKWHQVRKGFYGLVMQSILSL